MALIGGIVALVAVLVALTTTVAVYPAVWTAFKDAWRRIPPERRQRVWFGSGLAVGALAVVTVLLILEPWGSDTVLWVCLVGGGGFVLLALTVVAAQAVIDIRRARRHRIDSQQSQAT